MNVRKNLSRRLNQCGSEIVETDTAVFGALPSVWSPSHRAPELWLRFPTSKEAPVCVLTPESAQLLGELKYSEFTRVAKVACIADKCS